MSAFKRHQSKVFWNHMASQDVDNLHGFAARQNDRSKLALRQNLSDSEISESVEVEQDDEGERSSSINDSDTIDGENVTAIRVFKPGNENLERKFWATSDQQNVPTQSETIIESMDKNNDRSNDVLEYRSCSPLSMDLRSQDSGFSDSDRSNCGETYQNETPRRRYRRQKRVEGRQSKSTRFHPRIGSLWLENDAPPNPTFTSTPKDSRIPPGNLRNDIHPEMVESTSRVERTEDEEENVSVISTSISLADESLGDFLYAAEPPEDVVVPKSRAANTFESNCDSAATSRRSVLNSRIYRQSSSVRAWLSDLAVETDNECGSTLQSKVLPRRKTRKIMSEKDEINDLKTLSSLATAAASKLLVRAEQFDGQYQYILEKMAGLGEGRSEKELVRAIEEAAFSILSELGAPPPRRIQQRSTLKKTLAQLEGMKNYVNGAVDTRLDFYIEKVVRGLEEAPKDDTAIVRGSLAALTALGLTGPRAGSSIARCSGIRALLTCLITAGSGSTCDLIAACLRALSSVCCSTVAIEHFAKDCGPEILTDLLVAEYTSEKEKMEATALVVQLTAPWVDAIGLPYLETFADSLVPGLDRLAENTSCGQTLLLVAAALNHLTKSRQCASIILKNDTVKRLLRSVKKSTGRNVWLMEQVAALIGELARIPEARPHLAKARASIALVSFLRMRPPGLEDAYRRLEITAAAALTRLCVDPEIARQVVAVGGADCLPSFNIVDNRPVVEEDEERIEAGLSRYTKSLRRACKRAAKQIDIAKASDSSSTMIN